MEHEQSAYKFRDRHTTHCTSMAIDEKEIMKNTILGRMYKLQNVILDPSETLGVTNVPIQFTSLYDIQVEKMIFEIVLLYFEM